MKIARLLRAVEVWVRARAHGDVPRQRMREIEEELDAAARDVLDTLRTRTPQPGE